MTKTPESLTGDDLLEDALRILPDALDRLAGLHPALACLRGPAKARALPRLVRLADVAQMAEVPVETVLDALRGVAVPTVASAAVEAASGDDWFTAAARGEGVQLDVRSMLAEGDEPFQALMSAAARVPPGGLLVVDAPFDPVPLRRVLAGKGFGSQGRKLAEDHWRICFRRDGGGEAAPEPVPRRSGERWVEEDGVHLDVRGLDPPQPMVLILELIDGGHAEPFTVHHERDPIFLYPELEERGWSCRIIREGDGEVRLRLSRDPA